MRAFAAHTQVQTTLARFPWLREFATRLRVEVPAEPLRLRAVVLESRVAQSFRHSRFSSAFSITFLARVLVAFGFFFPSPFLRLGPGSGTRLIITRGSVCRPSSAASNGSFPAGSILGTPALRPSSRRPHDLCVAAAPLRLGSSAAVDARRAGPTGAYASDPSSQTNRVASGRTPRRDA